MKKEKIEKIFSILYTERPEAKIELEYTNAFTLLIAVILSAQSTDKQVNKITPFIFNEIAAPEDIVARGEEWLFVKIKSINYNKTKAKNIYKMSILLGQKFNSTVPSTLMELQMLPGVGRKSANVILNSIFGMVTMPVDTHVFRVANRIGLTNAKNVLQTELALLKILPSAYALLAHHLLVLHGRYICIARKPRCAICKIASLCEFQGKNLIIDYKS